jgi:hypothetical protein
MIANDDIIIDKLLLYNGVLMALAMLKQVTSHW